MVQKQLGRAIEAAQWGVTDANTTRMKGPLREVVEVRADGPSGETYRAAYYTSKDPAGPVVVLHAFKKKSTRGVSTPKRELDLIEQRLKRFKHLKKREKYAKLLEEGWEAGSGNVFADLGLPDADELQAKAYLRAAILARIEALGISQTEAARRTQLTQPKISNLLRGTSPVGFSSDKLMEIARKLGLDVELRVNAAHAVPGVSFLRVPASFRMEIIGAVDTLAAGSQDLGRRRRDGRRVENRTGTTRPEDRPMSREFSG